MALTVNAQFGKFLEFAQSQANAESSKAVARIVEDEKGEKAPLAGRNITVANGDHAYSRDRTDAEKSANDRTREAFRKAVADMFGERPWGLTPWTIKYPLLNKYYFYDQE